MDTYVTETEQIEQIKQWCKKYGKYVVATILLTLVIISGWRYWQQRHERMLQKASVIYERLLNAAASDDKAAMKLQADRLVDHYRHTPYAEIAALMLARQAIENNNLPLAETKLIWITKHGNNKALRQLARVRVARVLLAEHRPEEALKFLDKVEDAAYLTSIKETEGDVYVSLGKMPEARKAYEAAIQALPGTEVMQPLLQMKLDNLAAYAQPSSA